MQQVLFRIPGINFPVYGFGVMLVIAISVAGWLASRRAEREGIVPRDKKDAKSDPLYDFVVWVVLGGLFGARLWYVIQFRETFTNPFIEFFKIWDGGIVFYGSAFGGLAAGLIARRRFLSRFNVSAWKLADVLAPSLAIGLCIGRIACFLNGCCWGHVASPDSPAVHFPLMTAPSRDMVQEYQTAEGFAMNPRATDERTVGTVEPGSAAEQAGLERGDIIVAVAGKEVKDYGDLAEALYPGNRPRGEKQVSLTVGRGTQEVALPPFIPRTIGLVPTQLYESVSMFLIFLVLIALYPLRRYDGQVMVVLMVCYAVHRFFNETLRHDTPTYYIDMFGAHISLGLTVSQWTSVAVFAAAVVIHVLRRRHTLRSPTAAPPPVCQPA
jgi:phosphatidylglycerol:prolipoprotein diacylglycerol transferase